jgi:hypothetical protein
MIRDGDFNSPLRLTGGHEACGTVVEVGSHVRGFKRADRIGTLPFLHACGECPDCKSGTYVYCEQKDGALGFNRDGAFGEVDPLIERVKSFSILFVTQTQPFISQTLCPLSMPPRYSAPGPLFTMLLNEPN